MVILPVLLVGLHQPGELIGRKADPGSRNVDGYDSFRVRGGSGAERVLALRCAGVESLVLAGEVEAPVVVEVAVMPNSA
jgi:hypothetical protein